MRTRRPSMTAVVLFVVVGVAGALVGEGTPAHAVVSIVSSGPSVIPYSGTVDGPPESIFLAGFILIRTVVVTDPDLGRPPIVLLDVDVSNVTGVGLRTGTRYVASGSQSLTRPLVASDVVDVTFAVSPDRPGGALSARSALASLTLNFNLASLGFVAAAASASVNVADSLSAVAAETVSLGAADSLSLDAVPSAPIE
jgi:hypothetical protein